MFCLEYAILRSAKGTYTVIEMGEENRIFNLFLWGLWGALKLE